MRLPVVSALFAGLVIVGGSAAAAHVGRVQGSSAVRCPATLVHYQPFAGVETGLAPIPWIAASPVSTALVGHLFYYDRGNVWKQKAVSALHIYAGGESPDGRVNMKILWQLRRGSAPGLVVRGRRLDRAGSLVLRLQGGGVQFPSIIDVPSPGCWRLTLTAGKVVGQVTAIAVRGRR
jgi:hypothetical protein